MISDCSSEGGRLGLLWDEIADCVKPSIGIRADLEVIGFAARSHPPMDRSRVVPIMFCSSGARRFYKFILLISCVCESLVQECALIAFQVVRGINEIQDCFGAAYVLLCLVCFEANRTASRPQPILRQRRVGTGCGRLRASG